MNFSYKKFTRKLENSSKTFQCFQPDLQDYFLKQMNKVVLKPGELTEQIIRMRRLVIN